MRRALPILLLAALALALPAGAGAATWKGTVTNVGDGDTLDVDVAGDGTPRPHRVRIAGVQAMELSVYAARRLAGDCHAVAATRLVERLVHRARGRVRLDAEHAASRSRGRFLRSVSVRAPGGWRDLGARLLRDGLALWLPTHAEPAHDLSYALIAQEAAAARRGLFDPDGCGAGPRAASPLALWVNWDADGADTTNPAGEWVRIRNLDPAAAVPLGGWHLRDSGLRRYTFPAHAAVPAGGSVTVDVGRQGELSWGLDAPVFENAGYDRDAMGDGAYLFDPLGNIRASMIYPCRGSCTDPLAGAVAVSADRQGRSESVTLANLTGGRLELDGYVLKSAPYSYALDGAALPPGSALRIDVGGDPADDTALERHWGFDRPILRDAGDVARLATYTDVMVACVAWGDKRC